MRSTHEGRPSDGKGRKRVNLPSESFMVMEGKSLPGPQSPRGAHWRGILYSTPRVWCRAVAQRETYHPHREHSYLRE